MGFAFSRGSAGEGARRADEGPTMKISSKRDIAKQLRHQQTIAEQKMWWLLRSRAFNGYKFCRQYLIGPVIADFCCRKRKLVIELDGSQHIDNQDYDQERTRYLQEQGYRVLRFWNRDFLLNQKEVLETILSVLLENPHPGCATLSQLTRWARANQDLPSPAVTREKVLEAG